ncbi:MAG: hypothetical protein EOM11_09765 [Erysipelotrichia bacterium]|nr:hypothetical protein [Erysipelotrichia bacterium]
MKKETIKIISCIVMSVLMVVVAEVYHEKEIIFPEIAALLIGAWAAPSQPWRVNKMRLFLLMSISTLVGIFIVRYIELALYWQIMIAFTYAVFAILLSRTSLVPLISACILPVIMQTETIIYPISVMVMSVIVIGVQYIMEKYGIREKEPFMEYCCDLEGYITWGKRYIMIAVYVGIAIMSKQLYLIAPPLFVIFVELSNRRSKLRSSRHVLTIVVVFASIIGYLARCLAIYFMLPLSVCALFAMLALFYLFKKTNIKY